LLLAKAQAGLKFLEANIFSDLEPTAAAFLSLIFSPIPPLNSMPKPSGFRVSLFSSTGVARFGGTSCPEITAPNSKCEQ
jgi:hypothetical protein